MLNTYDLDLIEVKHLLLRNGVLATVRNNQLIIMSNGNKAQTVIDQFYYQMPNLIPVQFHYMLNKCGFDDAINLLLPALKLEDLEKYAMYKAYLDQARFYEFGKALTLFNDIQDKFIAIDESLDFTVEQLKTMWLEASKV